MGYLIQNGLSNNAISITWLILYAKRSIHLKCNHCLSVDQCVFEMKQVLIKLFDTAPAIILAASLDYAIVKSKNVDIEFKN